MEFARETLGKENLEQSLKLCSSSAAGGLRMAVIGLTERLSYVAGRNTAFGAGGKIHRELFRCAYAGADSRAGAVAGGDHPAVRRL